MKKFIVLVLILTLICLGAVGCGAKEKLEEKAGEALAEKILEESGDVDVDIDGEQVTIKGEDGEEMTFGGTEWPTSDLAKNIPEFKDGKVASLMETTDSLMVNLEEVSEEDFSKYLEEIKADYTEDAYEANFEGSITYGAGNGAGITVYLYYVDETLTVTMEKAPEQ